MTPRTDRLLIDYTLAFNTPFHCGTGIRESLIDRTVVRDSDGYLYVPGSTLKGVLRDRCEQIARFYGQTEPAMNNGTPADTGMQRVPSPHDATAALAGLGKSKPTMITRIFGSQNKPGLLFFDDAYQSQEEQEQYDSLEEPMVKGKGKYQSLQVSVSTQVRLDRPTRTAVPGALYTSEFGNNDITFYGTIQGWITCTPIPSDAIDVAGDTGTVGTPTYSLLLLLAGLRMLERLGGNKSTGKGNCICTIGDVKINDANTDWQAWLHMLDALAQYEREGSA